MKNAVIYFLSSLYLISGCSYFNNIKKIPEINKAMEVLGTNDKNDIYCFEDGYYILKENINRLFLIAKIVN